MKSIIVTGSSGLIGSEVVKGFCADGWRVHGLDNKVYGDRPNAIRLREHSWNL